MGSGMTRQGGREAGGGGKSGMKVVAAVRGRRAVTGYRLPVRYAKHMQRRWRVDGLSQVNPPENLAL